MSEVLARTPGNVCDSLANSRSRGFLFHGLEGETEEGYGVSRTTVTISLLILDRGEDVHAVHWAIDSAILSSFRAVRVEFWMSQALRSLILCLK